jgi:Sec-independent protein translocase protein TatA
MDFLGIGPLEIIFILIIALIIFGPKDIVKAGQSTGRFLRRLVMSPGWKAVQKTSQELRNIPNKLIREAGLDEVQEEMKEIKTIATPPDFRKEIQEELDKVEDGLSAWTTTAKPEEPQKSNEIIEKQASGESGVSVTEKPGEDGEDQ